MSARERCAHARKLVTAVKSEEQTARIDGESVTLGPDPVPVVVYSALCLDCASRVSGTYEGLAARDSWAVGAINAIRHMWGDS